MKELKDGKIGMSKCVQCGAIDHQCGCMLKIQSLGEKLDRLTNIITNK